MAPNVRPSARALRGTVRRAAGACVLALVISPSLLSVGSAHAASDRAQTRLKFDVKLYERYAHRHKLREIPYKDRGGHITPFAHAWMRHRHMCGGAVTAIQTNPTTLSHLQEWQGCTAVQRIGENTIKFHRDPWIA